MVRDLMIGNGKLADPVYAKKHGFKPDVELAQGCNAIAAGTQGQRQHTDGYPNFDFTEAVLCSSWDWDGPRQPFINATENDGKNGLGMCIAHHLSGGLAQLFADIRTNWDPESIKKATGISVKRVAPGGVIDKRNSGAGALDYAVNPYEVIGLDPEDTTAQQLAARLQDDKSAHAALIKAAQAATVWEGANLTYFPGDGLSSSYSTPGTFPMTAYRLNCVGSMWTLSVVEGDVVQLPAKVVTHISRVTDATWPESYWAPRGMSSFDYMRRIGPNHDANSFGLIGADWITLAAMLRIPVDMHNVPAEQIFRPTIWERFGGDDFRVCEKLGPLYV
jgi:L-fucose isomerase